MKACLDYNIRYERWLYAASAAGNLSELLLTLGRVEEAVDYARQSVTHADKSDNWQQKVRKQTTLADTLHQFGKIAEAEIWFRKAEALQKENEPEFHYLHSLPGFRYCDLLLDHGKIENVQERVEEAIKVAHRKGWLLDIALDTLTLGRVWLMQVVKGKTRDFNTVEAYLSQTVEGLWKSGRNDIIPLGLFVRAEYYRVQQDFEKAWQDLNEVLEIVELGSMKLYMIDYHLEAGRLYRAQNKEIEAEKHFRTAKVMIEETGYHRRDGEI
jgi:tetratricopeptide (TPR) repeat protein